MTTAAPLPWLPEAQALVARAAAGDAEAAGRVASLARTWILRLAAQYLPHRDDAEDVAQDVVITVMRSVGGVRDPERLRSWLASVTLNQVRASYRRWTREADLLRRAGAVQPVDDVAPGRVSSLAGYRVDLLDGMERLPPHKAFALGLRQLGLDYPDVAAEMSQPERLAELFPQPRTEPVPEGSVRRWVKEARDELLRSIGD